MTALDKVGLDQMLGMVAMMSNTGTEAKKTEETQPAAAEEELPDLKDPAVQAVTAKLQGAFKNKVRFVCVYGCALCCVCVCRCAWVVLTFVCHSLTLLN